MGAFQDFTSVATTFQILLRSENEVDTVSRTDWFDNLRAEGEGDDRISPCRLMCLGSRDRLLVGGGINDCVKASEPEVAGIVLSRSKNTAARDLPSSHSTDEILSTGLLAGPALRAVSSHSSGMVKSIGESTVMCSEDSMLHESVLRAAGVVDVDDVIHQRLGDARGSWSTAPVILLGCDAVADALVLGLPRRARVVIVNVEDSDVWRTAVHMGAEAVVTLTGDCADLISVLMDRDHTFDQVAPVVVVTGGCGGSIASHFAVAIARAGAGRCARRRPLIDANDLGGEVEWLVDLENAPGLL